MTNPEFSHHNEYNSADTRLPVRDPESIKDLKELTEVNFWIPRKLDIYRMLEAAAAVHDKSKSAPLKILDVGGGNGFLGKLLVDAARERNQEVDVTVLEPDTERISKAQEIYSSVGNLHFVEGLAQDREKFAGQEFDLVVNAWMHADQNLIDDIEQMLAKVVIYLKDRGGATGPGEEYPVTENFTEIAHWRGPGWVHARSVAKKDEIFFKDSLNDEYLVRISDSSIDQVDKLKQALKQLEENSPPTYVWENELNKEFPPRPIIFESINE